MAQATTSRETSDETFTDDYELETHYDARKSFYGKAWVFGTHIGDGSRDALWALHSYGKRVATYTPATGRLELLPGWDTSATTVRHVKEFARQVNFRRYADVTASQLHKEYNREHQ